MRIRVTLSGPLREFYKTTPFPRSETIVVAAGARVHDVMACYAISSDKVHLIFVNRYKADRKTCLKEDDHVWLIPLAAGG